MTCDCDRERGGWVMVVVVVGVGGLGWGIPAWVSWGGVGDSSFVDGVGWLETAWVKACMSVCLSCHLKHVYRQV